jgi:hypothetical protein
LKTMPAYPHAAALATDLAQRCEQATLKGERWQACCPAHEDRSPSLSITPAGNRVLIHCHAGCTNAQIMAALGLQLSDLFVEPRSPNGHKRIVKVYAYVDAHGHILHETVRYEPKDFRQRRPDPAHPGEYIWSLKGIEPVLYNLPAVLAAIEAGDLVHLAEGEKDAESLKTFGLVATTVPMGAKHWRDSYTETLTGAHVVLWPDNDEAGQACTAKVQRHLTGTAASLRVVPVPVPHKDVSDWVKAGATRVDVDARVLAHEPPPAPLTLAAALVSYGELQALQMPKRETYLEWLMERSLVMVYGPRGVGKTMALLGLSVSLTTGQPFLKWPIDRTTGVLYVEGEMPVDELRDRARLMAGGTEPACLAFLPSELAHTRLGRDVTLTTCDTRKEIEAILQARPALRVLILDNISCLFPGISEDKKQDWEPINQWLIRLRHMGLTVILGHHAGKGGHQRGTSGREDSLNTTIALSFPPGYRPEDGCHFFLRFEKSRGLKGPAVEGLDVRFDEHTGWTQTALEEVRTERLKLMLADGVPPRIIAEELGVSASYVYRQKRYLGL